MKISLISLVLGGFLFFFIFGNEAASKRSWSNIQEEDPDVEDEDEIVTNKAARISSDFKFHFFEDQNKSDDMYTEDFRNKVMITFMKCNKVKIDELMEMNYDVFAFGVWDELIRRNSYAGIRYLLSEYFFSNKLRRKAFEDAIIYGATSLVKFIFNKFKSTVMKKHATFVNLACDLKRYKILKMMASEGFTINRANHLNDGKYYLHEAVISDDLKLVKALLKFNDMRIHCNDKYGNTPLHYASSVEIVKVLMEKGANPYLQNYSGMDSIIFAVNLERPDIVKALVPDLIARFEHFHLYFKKTNHPLFQRIFIISRERVLEDSYYLASKESNWYKAKYLFEIEFEGETGIDRGGLSREWMSLLIERLFVPRLRDEPEASTSDQRSDQSESSSREVNESDSEIDTEIDEEEENILNYLNYLDYDEDDEFTFHVNGIYHGVPNDKTELYFYAPFECVDAENKLYRISSKFTGPVEIYKFIGSIIAKSLLWKNPLKVKLVPSILKLILGKTLTFDDLMEDDLVMFRSMLQCLEPGFDFDSAAYTLPSDENIMVDAGNVKLFLDETANEAMYKRYKAQLDQLIEGFTAVIYHEKVAAYFSPIELQNILSGDDKIDRVQLIKSIEIRGNYWTQNKQILTDSLDSLQDGELIELIRFITGINGMPFGGISSLGKNIKIYDETNFKVPKVSTCNFHLSLPTSIKTVEELVQMFRVAIASEPEFVDCRC